MSAAVGTFAEPQDNGFIVLIDWEKNGGHWLRCDAIDYMREVYEDDGVFICTIASLRNAETVRARARVWQIEGAMRLVGKRP